MSVHLRVELSQPDKFHKTLQLLLFFTNFVGKYLFGSFENIKFNN